MRHVRDEISNLRDPHFLALDANNARNSSKKSRRDHAVLIPSVLKRRARAASERFRNAHSEKILKPKANHEPDRFLRKPRRNLENVPAGFRAVHHRNEALNAMMPYVD